MKYTLLLVSVMLTGLAFADKNVTNNDPIAIAGANATAKAKGGKAIAKGGSDVNVENKSLGLGSVSWAPGQTGVNLGGVVGFSTVSKKTVEGQNLQAIQDQAKREAYICVVRTDYEKAKHLPMCQKLQYFINRAAKEKNRGRYVLVKEAHYGDDH